MGIQSDTLHYGLYTMYCYTLFSLVPLTPFPLPCPLPPLAAPLLPPANSQLLLSYHTYSITLFPLHEDPFLPSNDLILVS